MTNSGTFSKKYKSSTLQLIYYINCKMLVGKHDVNIVTYDLKAFLMKKSDNYVSKKSNVLSDNTNIFHKTAAAKLYLVTKVTYGEFRFF